jgi:hypothetical protein
MTTEKKFILISTHPKPDGSIACVFAKATIVDGVEEDEAEPHLLVVPRYVGPNNDIPSNRPYLRFQLDLAADSLGYQRCTDADWQTILYVCEATWGELPPDPEWTPPTPEELVPLARANPVPPKE